MKVAKATRRKRRDTYEQQIFELEKQGNLSDPVLLELKHQIKLEEVLEAERAVTFTREFWAGKVGTLGKEIFG